jgi:hypothetical protein
VADPVHTKLRYETFSIGFLRNISAHLQNSLQIVNKSEYCALDGKSVLNQDY